MKTKVILIISLSSLFQNCSWFSPKPVEIIQKKAEKFVDNLATNKNLSKEFVSTFGIQNQKDLASLQVANVIPVIYLKKDDFKDFNSFTKKISDSVSNCYFVQYSYNEQSTAQSIFTLSEALPVSINPTTCGDILYIHHPNVIDRTTGTPVPLGLPFSIIEYDDTQFVIYKFKESFYGTTMEQTRSNVEANDLEFIDRFYKKTNNNKL